MAGAAEGPGGAGVTVLRLWAATSQTSHLAVCPINHLYELSHPEDTGEGGREESRKGRNTEQRRDGRTEDKESAE